MPSVRRNCLVKANGALDGVWPFVNMGQLTFNDFPWPVVDSLNTSVVRRETNTIFVKGLKIHRRFEYRFPKGDPNDIGPIQVHWALCQLKNDEVDAEIIGELSTSWFRDNSDGADRTRNFNTYTATDAWDEGKNQFAINPNNKVRVLTHKKKVIHPYHDATGNYTYQSHQWTIDRYYKVKKNFWFADITRTNPNQRIFEVYWYNTDTARKFPTTNADGAFLSTTFMHSVYYCNIE